MRPPKRTVTSRNSPAAANAGAAARWSACTRGSASTPACPTADQRAACKVKQRVERRVDIDSRSTTSSIAPPA